MERRVRYLAALLCAAAIMAGTTGCSRRVGSLAIASTKTPQYDRLPSAPIVKGITGEDKQPWFLIFPLGRSPKFAEAIDRALEEAGGDFMVNVRFYRKDWTVILFSRRSVRVVGDVGNSKARDRLVMPSK